jgi:hypothetical protein
MSLLGKIFAILNLAGLAGFFYVATLDYAKRQAWAYAVFRQDLAIGGIPLDETQTDLEGNVLVERIGERTRKELFPQGTPVATQEEEVKRIRDEVNRLAGQPAAAGRKGLAFYATLLMPFAQTNSERERLRAYRAYLADDRKADALKQNFVQAWNEAERLQKKEADPQKKDEEPSKPPLRDAVRLALDARHYELARPFIDDVLAVRAADAAKPLDAAAFDQVLESQRTALAKQTDDLFKEALKRDPTPEEAARPDPNRHNALELRRRRIARLLFNLAGPLEEAKGAQPGPEDLGANAVYRRFLTVVGLRQGVQAVRDEADNLAGIAPSLISAIETTRSRDRSLFAGENDKLIDRIKERAAQVQAEAALLVRTQQLVAAHEEQLKKRRRDVKQYEDELAEAQAATMKELKELRKVSANLFDKRIDLREKTEDNQKLEKEIRSLESEVSPVR